MQLCMYPLFTFLIWRIPWSGFCAPERMNTMLIIIYIKIITTHIIQAILYHQRRHSGCHTRFGWLSNTWLTPILGRRKNTHDCHISPHDQVTLEGRRAITCIMSFPKDWTVSSFLQVLQPGPEPSCRVLWGPGPTSALSIHLAGADRQHSFFPFPPLGNGRRWYLLTSWRQVIPTPLSGHSLAPRQVPPWLGRDPALLRELFFSGKREEYDKVEFGEDSIVVIVKKKHWFALVVVRLLLMFASE